jgi:hypothetical protein
MTQFHEGQDVDVYACWANDRHFDWRKAKIVRRANIASETRMNKWLVQFPDGSRSVFNEEHIRAAPFENSGLNEELQKYKTSKRDFAGRKGENPTWE